MKACVLLLLTAIALLANAQDKPRVFVQGKGSENVSSAGGGGGGRHWGSWGSKSTIDSHDESMQVTRDLQKDCSGVIVTISQANSDYIIMMNRESKQNRGLLRTNSQIQIANRAGDILGTSATRTVGNASKDACNLILADWQAHGRLNVQEPPASLPSQPPNVQPGVQVSPTVQTAPAVTVPATPSISKPAEATPASKEEGKIILASVPDGADVYVDDGFVGNAPATLKLPAGKHTVKVSQSGYAAWTKEISVFAGSEVNMKATLEKNP